MIRIREFRKKKGLSQQEMADLLEINQSGYAHYENGRREPNIKTLAKIAIILEVSIDDLIEFRKIYDELHENLYNKILEKESK